MTSRAFITGLAGLVLLDEERAFLKEAAPWGLILFARNVQTPEQVRILIEEARTALGWRAPVLIDQEGGRVQRMRPPHWRDYPPGEAFGRLYQQDPERGLSSVRLNSRLIAADLAEVGIDVDCLPVADLRLPEGHGIIGNRAYGDTPEQVSALARAAAEGLLEGGVLPVVKHIPGHGRAPVDSHERLPQVDAPRELLERTDFATFRPLNDLPLAMTAHVVYSAIDPDNPATTSKRVMDEIVRGFIGFTGLVMSDDLSMGALAGTLATRSVAALAAGCDMLLHCNGRMDEMMPIAAEAPLLSGLAAERADAALAFRKDPAEFDLEAVRRELAALADAPA